MTEKIENKPSVRQRLKQFNLLDLRLLLSGLSCFTSSIGYIRGFTVLIPHFKSYLNAQDKVVSLFPSFLLLGVALAGLFIGYFIPKYGNRNLVLISGIISMAGSFLFTFFIQIKMLVPACATMFILIGIPEGFQLTCAFDASRKFGTRELLGMIMTLQTAGVSLGAFILPPLYRLALKKSGSIITTCYFIAMFQKSLNIISGLLLPYDSPNYFKSQTRLAQSSNESEESHRLTVNILSAEEAQKQEVSKPIAEKPKFFSRSLFTTPFYYTFIIGISLFLLGYFSTIPFIKGLLTSYEITSEQTSSYLLLLGIVELCARLIYAIFLVDAYNPINLLATSYIGDGIGCILLCVTLFLQRFLLQFKLIILTVGIIIFGFFNAGFGGVMNATLVKIVPPEKFAVGMGMYQLSMGLGNSLGPVIGGSIVDIVRNQYQVNGTTVNDNEISLYDDPYWATFVFGSCVCMIPAGLVILRLKRWFPD